MIKLYGFVGSRSSRVEWLLHELEAEHEFVFIDARKGAHKEPEHLARHPHGLVPSMDDGDLRLIESAAMCLHLADKFADKGLAPALGSPARARYYEYAFYAVSTLDPHVVPLFFHTTFLPPERRDPAKVEASMPSWEISAAFLRNELGKGPYLLGEAFSAADVIVGYDLFMAQKAGLLGAHPELDAYTSRLTERPAFKKTYRL